jgi:hypothetical protein
MDDEEEQEQKEEKNKSHKMEPVLVITSTTDLHKDGIGLFIHLLE